MRKLFVLAASIFGLAGSHAYADKYGKGAKQMSASPDPVAMYSPSAPSLIFSGGPEFHLPPSKRASYLSHQRQKRKRKNKARSKHC